MDYEFHNGDYVETKDGIKGYIVQVLASQGYFKWMITDTGDNENVFLGEIFCIDLSKYKRVGQYDFTKKDLNQIEHCISTTSLAMLSKINELVNAVNELREKSINK